MALSFRQTALGNGTTSPVTSAAFASQPVVGNIIVVTVVDDAGISEPSMTVTDNATGGSNTYTRLADTGAANTGTHTLWWAKVARTVASLTVVVTNPGGAFARLTSTAQEIQGFVGTPTFDKVSAYATGSSTTALSATSGTLTNANEIVVGSFAHYATVSAFTLGTGYTNLGTENVANAASAQETKVVAATTAVTASATIAAAREWTAYVATFYDAAAATTRTETGVARITATTLKTVTGVARIQQTTTKVITGVANIIPLQGNFENFKRVKAGDGISVSENGAFN